MRAARLRAIGDMRIEDLDEPEAGTGQAALRVEACGIDGTDRHIFHGEYPAALPVTPGHECAGTVARTTDSSLAPVGMRATVDPNISCGHCPMCRQGEPALCPNRVALGVDLDGGLAEYVVTPIAQLYAVPDSMPFEHAALCEPLACCLHAMDLAAVRPGMRVAILGGGVIGQLMVQLARLAGAIEVLLVTRQAPRRLLAEELGATATLDPRAGDLLAHAVGAGGAMPGGADVILECAGTVETFEQSVRLARRGGTVVVFGVAPQGELARISPFGIFERELRIQGSYLNPLTHGRAVDLLGTGQIMLDSLITRRLGLEEVPHALEGGAATGEVKSVVFPWQA